MKNAIESASDLQFFRPIIKHMICSNCGRRLGKDVNNGGIEVLQKMLKTLFTTPIYLKFYLEFI
jgi:hypothetical protein